MLQPNLADLSDGRRWLEGVRWQKAPALPVSSAATRPLRACVHNKPAGSSYLIVLIRIASLIRIRLLAQYGIVY